MRKVGKIAVAVVLAFVAALPGAADTLVQTFEDPTWDEDPSIPLAESIAKLREVHPYLVDVRGLDLIRTRRVPATSVTGSTSSSRKGFRGFGPCPIAASSTRRGSATTSIDDFRPVSSGSSRLGRCLECRLRRVASRRRRKRLVGVTCSMPWHPRSPTARS